MSKLTHIVWNHLKQKDVRSLKTLVNSLEVFEILDIMWDLTPEERVVIYRLLSKEKALHVFEAFDPGFQQTLLATFTEERVKEFINEMAPDDRVKLLDELPASVTNKLINQLSEEERKETAILMGFSPETAGRIMTTEFIRLNKEMTIAEAIKKIQKQGHGKESVYTLYVTNQEKILEGVISLRDIIMSEPEDVVGDIMASKFVYVDTHTDQEAVAEILQDLDLYAVPVVDSEKRLVGMVTIDDAMDILEEEMTEDIFEKAGLLDLSHKESDRSDVLINGSIWDIWKVRLPFLVITLIGGMLAGAVVGVFEETLEAIVAVSIFIPVIMDMGGNAGTQSSTIFGRGLVLGHIHPKLFMKHWLKETGLGLSMGLLIGICAGAFAFFWQGLWGLALAVGIALTVTMTLATSLGFMIPYLLLKAGLDQAAGSDPIITTIKDITGLLIYFVLVNTFLTI